MNFIELARTVGCLAVFAGTYGLIYVAASWALGWLL